MIKIRKKIRKRKLDKIIKITRKKIKWRSIEFIPTLDECYYLYEHGVEVLKDSIYEFFIFDYELFDCICYKMLGVHI